MCTVVPLQVLWLAVEADADDSWIVKCVHGSPASLSRLSGVDEAARGQLDGLVRSASTNDRAPRPCTAAEASVCTENRIALGAVPVMAKQAVNQCVSRVDLLWYTSAHECVRSAQSVSKPYAGPQKGIGCADSRIRRVLTQVACGRWLTGRGLVMSLSVNTNTAWFATAFGYRDCDRQRTLSSR